MLQCSSLARHLVELGHTVRLIPPQYVTPYVKRNKTDAADSEAICEAVTMGAVGGVVLVVGRGVGDDRLKFAE
jgi:transposase